MKDDPIAFKDLAFREKILYVTASQAHILGWALLFIGLFLPPLGEIDSTVLTGFGMSLVFCSGLLGVTMYIKGKYTEIATQMAAQIRTQLIRQKSEEPEQDPQLEDKDITL